MHKNQPLIWSIFALAIIAACGIIVIISGSVGREISDLSSSSEPTAPRAGIEKDTASGEEPADKQDKDAADEEPCVSASTDPNAKICPGSDFDQDKNIRINQALAKESCDSLADASERSICEEVLASFPDAGLPQREAVAPESR